MVHELLGGDGVLDLESKVVQLEVGLLSVGELVVVFSPHWVFKFIVYLINLFITE